MILNYMKNGVKFNDKHSIDDWGMVTTKIDIGEPKAKTNYVDIPGMNGSLDLTESMGEVVYENRTINLEFFKLDDDTEEHSNSYLFEQEIRQYLHGKEVDVYFDSDKSFYWHGRAHVTDVEMQKGYANIKIELNVEPYKYDVTLNGAGWLWDPFDFETGLINILLFDVTGSYTVTLLNRSMKASPTITASTAMKLKFKNKIYTIPKGTHKMYDVRLEEGENELVFTGTGTIEITYKAGVL